MEDCKAKALAGKHDQGCSWEYVQRQAGSTGPLLLKALLCCAHSLIPWLVSTLFVASHCFSWAVEALNSWYFWQYNKPSNSNLFHTSTCSFYRGAINVRAVQEDAEHPPEWVIGWCGPCPALPFLPANPTLPWHNESQWTSGIAERWEKLRLVHTNYATAQTRQEKVQQYKAQPMREKINFPCGEDSIFQCFRRVPVYGSSHFPGSGDDSDFLTRHISTPLCHLTDPWAAGATCWTQQFLLQEGRLWKTELEQSLSQSS